MFSGNMAQFVTSGQLNSGSQGEASVQSCGDRTYGGRDFFESSKFQSERFFSSPPQSSNNDYCPYSLRQTQLSIDYQYDILLVYDPDENSFYLDKLMECLEPQNLNIFDFIRDSPPGLPQRKILQSALQACRYTCIVITKKFISSFWLQLKTDMSIQDMLDRGNKMYSVIVIVMDPTVKKEHLPLDLATLSPLFYTEKFFENRLKLAFQKEAAFSAKSLPLPQLKQPEISRSNEKYYSPSATVSYHSNTTSNRHHFISGHVSKEPLSTSSGRLPQESQESALPPPLHSAHSPRVQADPSMIGRGMSITVSSTGCRKPQESSDPSLMERAEAVSTNYIAPLEIGADYFRSLDSSLHHADNCRSTSGIETTADNFFSISSCKDIGPQEIQSDVSTDDNSYAVNPSAFFDLGQSTEETRSTYSDLEISTESLRLSAESFSKTKTDDVQDTAEPKLSESAAYKTNENIQSMPAKLQQNESMPECKTDDVQDSAEPKLRESAACKGNENVQSLPVNLQQNERTGMPECNPKKSHSVRSLVGSKFYKIKNSFSMHRKKQ